MPKPGMDVPICVRVPVSHAVNPIVDVVFAVIAQAYWLQFIFGGFVCSNHFGFPAFYGFFQSSVKIKSARKALVFRNEEPPWAAFSTMREQGAFFTTDTGIVAKFIGII
jgi:hypothetical protein